MTDILNRIIEYRKAKGLTQKQMADLLGIGQVSYSQIETGKTEITLQRIFKIAEILKVDLVSLLFPDFNVSHQLQVQDDIIQLLQKLNNILENERALLYQKIKNQDAIIKVLMKDYPGLQSLIDSGKEYDVLLREDKPSYLESLYNKLKDLSK